MKLCALVLLLVGGTSLWAEPIEFERAYFDKNVFEFDVKGVDWKALAMASLKDPELKKVSPAELKAMCGQIQGEDHLVLTRRFLAQVPASLAKKHFYLISAGGVRSVHPTRMKGYVRYNGRCAPPNTPEDGMSSEEIVSDGAVEGDGSQAGFVVISEKPLVLSKSDVQKPSFKVMSEGTSRYQFTENGKPPRLSENANWDPDHKDEITVIYRLRITRGEEYLFVQWAPDVCLSDLSLFELGKSFRVIARNPSGCDV